MFAEKLTVTAAESDYLSKATYLQSESFLWYEHRRGRITSSKFKVVCNTSIDSPSSSLVNSILKGNKKIKAPALEWGLTNESHARRDYTHVMEASHTSFKVTTTGLHVSPHYPHLGASPDGLISCSCCNDGLLEIKCPYSFRYEDPTQVKEDKFTSRKLQKD